MIFQYSLLLIFCGVTALSVSTETCGKDLLVGTSCIMKLRTKNNEKLYEIKWTHDRNGDILRWRDGRNKVKAAEGVSKEEDGSLRFESVSLKDTGTYTYTAFNTDGTEIGRGAMEIKVYEKVPKPTVKINCTADGNAALSCDVENSKDPSLNVSWYEDGKLIQNEIKPQVFLSSTQVQENKPYSCETHNPVSRVKSENVTVSCEGSGLTILFGLDFWIMVGILSGGSALLLLLTCVLIICMICSCCKKHQQDHEEFGLADLTPDHTDTNTKAQIHAQPPPLHQDEDEEYPTPIPYLSTNH